MLDSSEWCDEWGHVVSDSRPCDWLMVCRGEDSLPCTHGYFHHVLVVCGVVRGGPSEGLRRFWFRAPKNRRRRLAGGGSVEVGEEVAEGGGLGQLGERAVDGGVFDGRL